MSHSGSGNSYMDLSNMPMENKQQQTMMWQQNQYLTDSGIHSGATTQVSWCPLALFLFLLYTISLLNWGPENCIKVFFVGGGVPTSATHPISIGVNKTFEEMPHVLAYISNLANSVHLKRMSFMIVNDTVISSKIKYKFGRVPIA